MRGRHRRQKLFDIGFEGVFTVFTTFYTVYTVFINVYTDLLYLLLYLLCSSVRVVMQGIYVYFGLRVVQGIYVLRVVCRVFTCSFKFFLEYQSKKNLLHAKMQECLSLFEQIRISPKLEAYCIKQIQNQNQRPRLSRNRPVQRELFEGIKIQECRQHLIGIPNAANYQYH